MDKQFLEMILNLIVVLPFIILLIYISVKYGGNKLQHMQSGKFIKIIERVSLSKDSTLSIAKIGDKVFLIASNSNNTEILMEIDEEQLKKMENVNSGSQYGNLNKFIIKLKSKKEDKNE